MTTIHQLTTGRGTDLVRRAAKRIAGIGLSLAALLAVPTGVVMGAGLDKSLAGVWAQRGYGRIFDISNTDLVTYDVTDISCVRLDKQPLAEVAEEFDRVTRIQNGFTLFEVGGITRYEFQGLRKLPERCRNTNTVRDPETNFWVLWHAFRENYAFFDLRGVSWNGTYARLRPGVSAATTQDDLFQTLSQMLKPLNDGHIELVGGEREFSGGADGELLKLWKSTAGSDAGYDAAVSGHVVDYVLKGKVKRGANGSIIWGWAAPGVGYINTMSMDFSDDTLPGQLDLVKQAMAQAMLDLRDARALIVDARFNDGGHDAVALKIMGSFTRERRLAFTKKAVDGEAYTPTQQIYFEPSGSIQFTRPIYYLQSGTTISAAEIFSLAMMVLPNVTSIGTRTYGVLSDQLEKTLPNGWTVTLSNEVYLAADGKLYEGCGIPPDVAVSVQNIRDFQTRLRLDITTALSLAGAQ